MFASIHSVATVFRDTPALSAIFLLLTFVGPALFGYLGYLGVARRRTLLVGRNRGAWVEGRLAVAVGAFYVLLAPGVFLVMAPVSAAVVGIW